MKKTNILGLLFVSSVMVSCTKNNRANENVEYEVLKDIKISEMSIDNQRLVKNQLVDILKDDKDFIKYSTSLQYIMMARLERIKNGHKEPMGIPPKDFNEKMAFYERNGIKKPKELIVNEINLVLAVNKLVKNHPEMKNLDPAALNEVLKQAVAKWNPNFGAQVGGMMKAKKIK